MAARRIRTDRVIAVMGVVVLALGVLIGWRLIDARGVSPWEPPPNGRALRQVRERMGPDGEVRLLEQGRGRVVCGYAGLKGVHPPIAFVSRPNRILFSDDPRRDEFRSMLAADCPGFPLPAPVPQAAP